MALKVGVIGAGGIFQAAHGPALRNHNEVELASLCDIDAGRANDIANQYGIERRYTDYRELLALPDIDAVDICTPNLFHSEIAIAALRAGKHVFCEKPDAIDPEKAEAMKRAAEESGKLLMVMRNNRFRPCTQFAKSYAEQGHMGEIYTGRCGWIRRRGIPGKGGWFTNKALSGGGPLIDLGVHFIDVAVWLMGSPRPVSVTGATYCKFAESELSDSAHSGFGDARQDGTFDVEDLATGFIRFENGATLQIEFSWASNIEEEMNFVELRGTKAGLKLVNDELKLFGETAGVLTDTGPLFGGPSISGHERNLHHFIQCVLGKEEPQFKPQEGVDMIKILTALYESARTGHEVRL